MSKRGQSTPKARQRKLIVQEMANETLVYDEDNHKAHCLNRAAAFVWKHCDGRTSVEQITRLMEKRMKTYVPEQAVWLALGQLEKSHLLEEPVARSAQAPQIRRRELIRNLGIAAITIPLVTSIVAPTATEAQTVTCGRQGDPCDCTDTSRFNCGCCVGFKCIGTILTTCQQIVG
jgi:hypothetical protein